MSLRLMTSIITGSDNKDDVKKRIDSSKTALSELLNSVQNCQTRYGGKSELATEDDIRLVQLCEKWENVLIHGLRTSLSNTSIQSIVTAGLNFTFNINTLGQALWSYTCLHLTKHEQERFTVLKNINTPLGFFRAFLRASLNERSLERYLHSWVGHSLVREYYEEGALLRDSEATSLLPNMAAGLASILFALSIDKKELNESQLPTQPLPVEHVIPLPAPVKTSMNNKKKPLRQVISFDTNESNSSVVSEMKRNLPNEQKKKMLPSQPVFKNQSIQNSMWNSAPATCLNSPDPKLMTAQNATTSHSEPVTSAYKNDRHFFPENTKSYDAPSQILAKLSERAKELFSSTRSVDMNVSSGREDDLSNLSAKNLRISESDSEEIPESINSSVSCLELCFTEDDISPDENTLRTALAKQQEEYVSLQLAMTQMEMLHNEKCRKMEKIILDTSRENERLKEQLRKYVSAVEIVQMMKQEGSQSEEVKQYERKLVQVAEMHAELMEFNEHLQRRLQDLEAATGFNQLPHEIQELTNVLVCIPAAFLVGHGSQSHHVYQVFVRVCRDEWNVYHRYAKFRELHMQLRASHPDVATFKFPPKKALRKKQEWVVEQRRSRLQLYLRHITLVLPQVRQCTTKRQLIGLLPFFGESCNTTGDNSREPSGLRRMFAARSSSSATTPPSDNAYSGL